MEVVSRDRVREAYSRSGREYDRIRLEEPRGRILSDYDVDLFLTLFPKASPSSRVLEVGAGTGRFTIPLLEQGYEIHATDINETMLAELRRKVEVGGFGDRCSVAPGNVFQLEAADDTYDLVFSFHVIPRMHAMDDQKAALMEMARVLQPGGTLIFNYRNRRSIYGRFFRQFAASPEEIAAILSAGGLQIVEKRGKWLLSRRTLDALPIFAGRLLARLERCLSRFWPDRAWDVVLTAVKREVQPE